MIQVKAGNYQGEVIIPSSKSDGQRAILSAALSTGTTRLKNVGISADEQAMLKTIEHLGASVNEFGDGEYEVVGVSAFPQEARIEAGESGLGVRLITGVCAGQKGKYTINGEGSLLVRPQAFFEEHLPNFGVDVQSNNGCLPLEIEGPMKGGKMDVDGSMSSQFLSGLLMSLPLITADSELHVHNLKSIPYVQMTLDTLMKFGIKIEHENHEVYRISGKQSYNCASYQVESDWSSAGYWLAAAAIGHDIRLKGLNNHSLQADRAMLEVLELANCHVSFIDDCIHVDGTDRKPFTFDATHCPDLFPTLVVLAAFCEGKTTLKGVHRLKNKESDRGVVLQHEFGKLGLEIELDGDMMTVHGGQELKSGSADSNNDHRIAMSLAIAGTKIKGGVQITDHLAVEKSYPQFWKHLEGLSVIDK